MNPNSPPNLAPQPGCGPRFRPWLRWSLPARTLLLGILLVLLSHSGPSSLPGQDGPSDPLDDLRKAFSVLNNDRSAFFHPKAEDREATLKAIRTYREATLKKIAERITSLGDLSRALLTPGWQFERDPITGKEILLARGMGDDAPIYNDLADRFKKGLEKVLQPQTDPCRLIAAAAVAGEFSAHARKGRPTYAPIITLNNLTGQLITLADHPDCLVRAAMVLALTQLRPKDYQDSTRFAAVYAARLADPDVFVRLATARALKDQIDDIATTISGVSLRDPGLGITERPEARERLEGKERPDVIAVWPDRKDYPRYAALILDKLRATPCTGLTDPEKYVRRAAAVLVYRAGQPLRELGEPSKEVSPNERRTLPDFPLGRKVTEADLAEIQRLREQTRKLKLQDWTPLVQAFRSLAPQLACAVLDDDLEVRLSARQAANEAAVARRRGRDTVENLLAQPGLPGWFFNEEETERQLLRELRQEYEEPSVLVKALGKGLGAPDLRSGPAAAEALETMGEPAAAVLPDLLKGLKDWNSFVRWNSAHILGKPGAGRTANDRAGHHPVAL